MFILVLSHCIVLLLYLCSCKSRAVAACLTLETRVYCSHAVFSVFSYTVVVMSFLNKLMMMMMIGYLEK